MSKVIAIQGETASFHAIAAEQYFDDDITFVSCQTFAETFAALRDDKVDFVLSAIENSLFGSINEVYDLLLKDQFWICGEIYLRIEQCLIGLPDANLKGIKEVHSHPVALAQCEAYLDKNLPDAERFEHHDTAGSVADVKKWADSSKAAIASAAAAEHYGMKVLAHEIETNKQNYTRFVVLSKDKTKDAKANKTSLILSTDHTPGALYNALGAFAKRELNLSKLQSRPIIGKAWHYIFYADVAASAQSKQFQAALDELTAQKCEVTVLGSYVSGEH